MSNGFKLPKNLADQKLVNEYERQEQLQEMLYKITKYAIFWAPIITIIWFLCILFVSIVNPKGNWDLFISSGEKFITVVIGYFLGFVSKKKLLD